jgi:hypothetical protein
MAYRHSVGPCSRPLMSCGDWHTTVGHNSVKSQWRVSRAYFLAIRLSARVIDFACVLGRGMAEPVDATR